MKTEPPTHLAFKRALLTRSPMPCNLIRFFCCRCCIASQTFPAVVLSCMVNSWRLDYFYSCRLRILTGKKHRQIKLQRLRKVRIWAFGSLVHQINSLEEVLKLKQNFQKIKQLLAKLRSL